LRNKKNAIKKNENLVVGIIDDGTHPFSFVCGVSDFRTQPFTTAAGGADRVWDHL
jgi:hypothetical protein